MDTRVISEYPVSLHTAGSREVMDDEHKKHRYTTLDLHTYCMFYVLAIKNRIKISIYYCVASYPSYLCCIQGHPYCTNSDILLLLFLLFLFLFLALDKKRLLNALNVNYIYAYKALHHE